MKIRSDRCKLLAAAGIFAWIGMGLVMPHQSVTAQTPPVPGRPAIGRPKPEQHRFMIAALHSLMTARDKLAHAAHDFGGHRVKALDAVNQAIEEINAGLAYDKQ